MFADEAFQLLRKEKLERNITLLQATSVLWMYEHAVGDPRKAAALLQNLPDIYITCGLSSTTSLQLNDKEDLNNERAQEVVSYIAWGFYCLST